MHDDGDAAAGETGDRPVIDFFARNWPYFAMLLLALGGVALTSITPGPMILYWEAVLPIFALSGFFERRLSGDTADRLRIVREEALHWGAVFLAMRMLMLPALSQMLNADATALMLLTVLALGFFTSGNLIGSWRTALVGVALAAAVPAIAWMERSALLVTLVVALVILGVALTWRNRR
jgi:hypothetical protein